MLKIRTSERSILMLLINRIAGSGEENEKKTSGRYDKNLVRWFYNSDILLYGAS